jgi:hypothetical protein
LVFFFEFVSYVFCLLYIACLCCFCYWPPGC